MNGAKMTEESAVKVCVRVRPLIKREESESSEPVQLFWRADKQAIHQLDEDGATAKSFSFDRVFSAAETTAQLYQDIAKPLVVSAVEGYNGTIFAYGQTSSGKTFSMMGSEHNPGVIPLAMADVFKTIKNFPKKEFLLRVSYMEIYNETVTDLLCDSWKRRPLEIREGNYKNVYVADLTEEMVTSPEQALSWITKGEKNRHYGKTKMNQRSSRSHTIFRMILESRDRSDPASGENADGAIIVSHLNLVDLAGAERASQTGAEGARLKEGCNINRSLFILGQVIKKLSDESQKGFVNYRDSKLTRILQNSLGGNAKTVIICTITPATVDETVSTLQFASAAKRMKNDPHVTEVSDEGALLKRYRNEIVDLRRRLQEVSSVTQTTETERETLCQLLQEKDQLQRDQQDRIKNLTKLLVTASNCALIPKVPKRRVTWGGKLLRSAHLLQEDLGSTDMSFAEPYVKKRRADCSLPEEGDDMDEFDSRFDFTAMDEPNLDMDMSSITVRSSSEGGNFLDSPRANELMAKVASLAYQLDTETQSKRRAEEMSAELQLKLSELQDQLEARATPSGQDTALCELEELRRHLEEQVQERARAEEKSAALELKLAELEKTSEALLRSQNTCERLQRDLEEAIQLCETVGFEKDAVIAERDLAKHTLDQLTSDLESVKAEKDSLQKDKDALQKDIEERRDADEFEKLEEEAKREYEGELESENSRLKQDLKRSEEMIQQLKADLATMSSELQKNTALTAELQRFSDKDLVHEVTCLRRSLDDAETLSLDTKKEWAFLRSENIRLKERDVTLTTDYEKMEAVVKTLQEKLELEKSRFRKMQTDLQRELMGAFDENTKLTALLDGKVPKNLTDNLLLEKTLCDVRKELDQSLERERHLQSKAEEVETLSVKVEELQTQVCVLSEELSSAREERDALVSAQSAVKAGAGETCVSADRPLETESGLVEEAELTRQITHTSERLQNIQTDLEEATQEKHTLLAALDEATQKSLQLSSELECVCGERDALLSEMRRVQSEPDEMEDLRRAVISQTEEREQMQEILQALRGERDQLKSDLEENVEMMIETQAELRDAQETVKDLRGEILNLRSQRGQVQTSLEHQMKQPTEEERPLCERSGHHEQSEALEQMKADLRSVTEEREQLRESLQQMHTLLEEKTAMILQVQSELQQQRLNQEQDSGEENSALLQIQTLKKELETLLEERNQLTLKLQETSEQVCVLSEELSSAREERDALVSAQAAVKAGVGETCVSADPPLETESGLVEEAELTRQITHTSERLQNIQTDLEEATQEKHTLLAALDEATQKSLQLSSELECVCGERDALLSEMRRVQSEPDEMEDLRRAVISQTEEREQMQEILQALRGERDQLKSDLEDSNGMLMQVQQERIGPKMDTHHDELLQQVQRLKEDLETTSAEKSQLKSDLQDNVEMMIENQEELRGALEKVKDLQNALLELESQRTLLEANLSEHTCEMEKMKASITSLTEEREQLQLTLRREQQDRDQTMAQLRAELQSVCAERDRVSSERIGDVDHMDRVTSVTEERDRLAESLQRLTHESEALKRDRQMQDETLVELRERLLCAENESGLQELQSSLASVSEEREQLLEILKLNREEKNQLRRDLEEKDQIMLQLREDLLSSSERTGEKMKMAEANASALAEANVSALTEERDRLLESLQVLRDEREQILREQQETLAALKTAEANASALAEAEANISALTEERDRLQESLQVLRDEREQILKEQQETLAAMKTDEANASALAEAEANISALTEERDRLLESLQVLRDEREQILREQQETLAALKTAEANASALAEAEANISALTEERDQLLESLQVLRDEREQILREQQETLAAMKTDEANASALAEAEANISALTEERDQLLESLQVLRDEREQQETLAAIKTAEANASALAEAEANISALTEERDRLLESLQVLRDEREQILREQQEKSEMMELLRQGLQSACAERDRLMSERDAACNQSSASVSVTSLSEGGDLQEILQGVRELIQVQGELKQKKHQESDPMSHRAQLQQIQALTEELESLRSRRERIQTDLQEAAATSKMYQDLLHLSKEELKQQQKETAELVERSAVNEAQLQHKLSQMSEDLSALSAVRDQLTTEIQTLQTNLSSLTGEKDELLKTLRRTREERDQLRLDLQKSEHTLTHIESKAEQLEQQKILLESEVHSLSLSLTEVNASVSDQSSAQSKHRSARLVSEIHASEEKLQAAFAKLQLIVDRPTDALHDVNRDEWAVIFPLIQFIPVAQRNVHAMHTTKTTRLNNVLVKMAEACRRRAQRCKTHFETEVQRDVALFEESRLQDLLVLTARAPAQGSPALQDDLQQVWDQRLTQLVERRQQFLQKLECVLRVLEDGVAKHSVLVSEERQHRTRALSDLKALLTSPQSAAIIQLHEQQITRRTKAVELLNAHYIVTAAEGSERETATLLKALNGTLPKAEAELLQDNLSLTLRLQQTQKQVEEVLEQTKDLKLQADSAHRTRLQLQELSAQLKQKQGLVYSLEAKLKEAEVQFKRNMTPAAAELADLKDKLVKMELDHIAVSTSHEKEMAQMSSMLEHRADVIRKLKESLRKKQQDDEQSFADGDEFVLNLGSNTRAVSSLKEKVEELQKKNAQFESLVSKQQEELHKWKRRAYKIKESVRDAPCTPKKRQPPLSQTEVNSPKRAFDSPKSKIFDSRSSAPLALGRPTQFFDNSSLGTMPEVSCSSAGPLLDSSDSDDEESSAAVGSSAATLDDWWQIPSASASEPDADANVNANACPTQ
ncbi:centromere-associated protein E [Pimephales promelas]|nr:centromere-associated protein E [Pimephales promelas]